MLHSIRVYISNRLDREEYMTYTVEELKELLKEFYEGHPGLYCSQVYDQVRIIERQGAEKFLWWLSHNKEYNIDYNWFYGSL